jgi:hypothetical protein
MPSPLRKASERGMESFREMMGKSAWRLKVEAPDFVKVEHAEVRFHSSQGPFAYVALRLKTDQPGQWNGNLIVRLSSTA